MAPPCVKTRCLTYFAQKSVRELGYRESYTNSPKTAEIFLMCKVDT